MRSLDSPAAATTATTALLLALAACLGYVETVLIPHAAIPGARLGLANIAIVLVLFAQGPARAAFVSIGRVVLVGLATGTLMTPVSVFALAGAMCSWAAMVMLARLGGERFSVVGWSIAGSAAHVGAQILVAATLLGTAAPLFLFPASLILALISGVAIGLVVRLLLSRLPSLSLSPA
jgi:heptaprenyl diphosphate synthase